MTFSLPGNVIEMRTAVSFCSQSNGTFILCKSIAIPNFAKEKKTEEYILLWIIMPKHFLPLLPNSPVPFVTRKSCDLGLTQRVVLFPYQHDRPQVICIGFPSKEEDES